MTKNTKAILEGNEAANLTLEELAEAVRFLAKVHDVNVDGQAYLDSDGDDELGAKLSDDDIKWCRRRNPRLAAKEHQKRIRNNA
jgi:hypothetical protein